MFIVYPFFSLFLSQFPSSYPVDYKRRQKPPPLPSAPPPRPHSNSCDSCVCSAFYSSTAHQSVLSLTPHDATPCISPLGSPKMPLCAPQHMPFMAFPIPYLTMALSQQQGIPPTGSQPNLFSFHTPHPLPFPQVRTTHYPAPYAEPEVAEQPVQVNIPLSSHCKGW